MRHRIHEYLYSIAHITIHLSRELNQLTRPFRQTLCFQLPESHSVRTNTLSTTALPNRLLPHRRSRMRRINHQPRLHKNPHMRHTIHTIPSLAPEQHVPCLSLRARYVFAKRRMILSLSRTRDGNVKCLAGCILGEAGAIEATA